MADTGRGPGGAVTARLSAEPQRFDFHQAVRLLRRLTGRGVGDDTPPGAEPVRLRVLPSLNFSAAAISKFTPAAADSPPELTVPLAGLTGPNGVLPQHYTALVQQRLRAKDTTLRDFLDLFHHRLLSLQVRAWEKERLPVAHEADPDSAAGTTALRSFAGIGTPGLQDRSAFDDAAFLHFCGLFARRPPTASGLEQVLGGYFGWPVVVEQFVGQWVYLDEENRSRLPDADHPLGRNAGLGREVVIGRRVWDVQSKIRVRVGPLDLPAFQSLQIGGAAREAFGQLARVYVGGEFDLEVNPLLAADAVPPFALEPDEIGGPRLARNVWLGSHAPARPAADSRFLFGDEDS
jgi:type VI secretion system protein ImpH